MTRERVTIMSAFMGAALLLGTAAFHFTGYRYVVGQAPTQLQPLIGAAWVAGGISLVLSAVLAIVAAPPFIVRRRAFLGIAALTPLSIAILQLIYLGFIPPTALLFLDTAILVIAAGTGVARASKHDAAA